MISILHSDLTKKPLVWGFFLPLFSGDMFGSYEYY